MNSMEKKRCEVCGKIFFTKHRTCGVKCGRVIQQKSCQNWWKKNKASFSAKQRERLGKKISTK